MAYNEELGARISVILSANPDYSEKKMFGGIAFMYRGNMCVGIVKDDLMARVGPDQFEKALEEPGVRQMDFTGRPMKGYVYVEQDSISDKKSLTKWIKRCERFVGTLPAK